MTCMKVFSERKGTVLEHSRLPLEKTISVMEHLREGCGIRGTSRLVKVHQNTVMRYARLAGDHAQKLHDELVSVSPMTREVQFDEKWSFVYKKPTAIRMKKPVGITGIILQLILSTDCYWLLYLVSAQESSVKRW